MKIHEYQAKELFQKYDVPIPRGQVAFSPEEALSRAQELGSFPVVIKAQIHAGGRGKGGGSSWPARRRKSASLPNRSSA
jgi:succinyl-CoA synthetase beta subunit